MAPRLWFCRRNVSYLDLVASWIHPNHEAESVPCWRCPSSISSAGLSWLWQACRGSACDGGVCEWRVEQNMHGKRGSLVMSLWWNMWQDAGKDSLFCARAILKPVSIPYVTWRTADSSNFRKREPPHDLPHVQESSYSLWIDRHYCLYLSHCHSFCFLDEPFRFLEFRGLRIKETKRSLSLSLLIKKAQRKWTVMFIVGTTIDEPGP